MWMRIAIWSVLMMALSTVASSQTYSVEGQTAYVKPHYMVMPDISTDYLNARGYFINEFTRAGIELITYDAMNRMIRVEEELVRVATWLYEAASRVEEEEVKDALSALGMNTFKTRQTLNALVKDGLVTLSVEKEKQQYITKSVNYYAWSDLSTKLERMLLKPHTFHYFSFTYTYRDSFSCGSTFVKVHGSINEISDGQNVPLMQFDFHQPQLTSRCPREIVPNLVRKMIPMGTTTVADLEATQPTEFLDFQWKGDTLEMKRINTILLVPKAGEDCNGIDGSGLSDQFALGLLSFYDVVDRSALEVIIEEQKFALQGLVRDADWIEAGELAGAEGILTMQCLCLGGKNMLKAKLTSVTSGVVLWSAILSDYAGTPDVKSITVEVEMLLNRL